MTMEFFAGNFDFGDHDIPEHVEYTAERLEEVRQGVNVDPSKYQVHRDGQVTEPFASEIDDLETAEFLREALLRESRYFELTGVIIIHPVSE